MLAHIIVWSQLIWCFNTVHSIKWFWLSLADLQSRHWISLKYIWIKFFLIPLTDLHFKLNSKPFCLLLIFLLTCIVMALTGFHDGSTFLFHGLIGCPLTLWRPPPSFCFFTMDFYFEGVIFGISSSVITRLINSKCLFTSPFTSPFKPFQAFSSVFHLFPVSYRHL